MICLFAIQSRKGGRKYMLKQRNKANAIIWHKETRMLRQQPFYGRHTS